MVDLKTIGKQLKRCREDREIKQYQLAETIGIGREYLSKIEAGKVNVTFKTLANICNALKVNITCRLEEK